MSTAVCVCCLVCVVQLSLQEMAFAWNVCHIHWCSYLNLYMTRYYQCFSRLTQRILFPSENGICVCICKMRLQGWQLVSRIRFLHNWLVCAKWSVAHQIRLVVCAFCMQPGSSIIELLPAVAGRTVDLQSNVPF